MSHSEAIDVIPSERVFVGRERELADLRARLDEVEAGSAQLVLIAGEAGIGKTRLAEEISREAAERGATIAWARCREGEGAPPFWPWVQVLRAWLERTDPEALRPALGAGGPYVAELLPELRERLPGLPAAPTSPGSEHARFYLFDAIAVLVRNAARQRALVLAFDDLQWADGDSMLLLEFVAAQTRDARVLLLGTYRDTEARETPAIARGLAALARAGRHLPLRGLSLGEVRLFLERQAPESAAIDPLARIIHGRSEGNPFFVDELVRVLAAEGAFRHPQRAAAGILPLPHGVREVLRRRLAPLPEACTRALAVASVVGREFDGACVSQAADLAPDTLLDVLAPAVAHGLVVRDTSVPGRFRFAHELIRETLYEDLSPAARARLHGRIGEILEALHQTRREPHFAALAHHFLESVTEGHTARGIRYAASAGRVAARALAYDEAIALFRRALEVLEPSGPADDADCCDLLLALGDTQWRAGDGAGARDTLTRAAELAWRCGDAVRLARSALGVAGEGLATLWVRTGTVDEPVVRLLEEALAALGSADAALRARLLARLAMELYFSADHPRVEQLSRAAVALARTTQDARVLATALLARSYAVWGPESADERRAIAGEILDIGHQLGDPEVVLLAHRERLIALLDRGDLPAADREIEAWAQGVAELREPLHLAHLARWRAMRAMLDGRFADAEHEALLAFEYGRRAAEVDAEQYLVLQLGLVRLWRGEFAEPEVRAIGERYPRIVAWRCGLAYLLAEKGAAADARQALAALAEDGFACLPRDVHWLSGMSLLSAACARLGEREHAEAIYRLLTPYAALVTQVGGGFACLGSVSQSLGQLAAVLGRREVALAHFAEALAVHRRMRAAPLVASTAVAYGALLVAGDDPAERQRGLALLEEARRTAEELGLRMLLGQVEAVGGNGRPRAERGRPAPEPAPHDTSVIRREGQFWTVTWDGRTLHLHDAKGLRFLAFLLRHPGREFHALALAAAVEPNGEDETPPWMGGDGGPVLDAQAQQAYRRRVADLRAELGEAERFNDFARAAQCREELEVLVHELTTSVGLGGRARRMASPSERARVNITKTVLAAIRRIDREHPQLGKHLHTTVRTGTFFSYTPDSRVAAAWIS